MLGREYADGEVICREGEAGDRMYVIQSGRAAVFHKEGGVNVIVGELKNGDIFGEMSIFDRKPRSATVCAKGPARVLTLDKRAFLRGVHEDPSLAYRILEGMSQRIRRLDEEVSQLKRWSAPVQAPLGRPRYVFVISRDRAEACERLRHKFSHDSEIQVLLDRRVEERRQLTEPHQPERRQTDRRHPLAGWAIHLPER